MTTQGQISQGNHRRAVRFFWALLIGAAMVSLLGNITHAVLPYVPHIAVQIGAAAVPPVVLLVAVHGIALAVRAGATGPIYRSAVAAVGVIGIGAFGMSFLALQDLMLAIGYSPKTAWIFPVIIDTTLAVCTLMLVALGDKPERRAPRVGTTRTPVQTPTQKSARSTKAVASPQFRARRAQSVQVKDGAPPVPAQRASVQTVQGPTGISATRVDTDLASELIALNATTQPVETVIAVLAAVRDGASINAAALASGINYRTAQRIVKAARQHGRLEAAS
jgi:hypothetical protein